MRIVEQTGIIIVHRVAVYLSSSQQLMAVNVLISLSIAIDLSVSQIITCRPLIS